MYVYVDKDVKPLYQPGSPGVRLAATGDGHEGHICSRTNITYCNDSVCCREVGPGYYYVSVAEEARGDEGPEEESTGMEKAEEIHAMAEGQAKCPRRPAGVPRSSPATRV